MAHTNNEPTTTIFPPGTWTTNGVAFCNRGLTIFRTKLIIFYKTIKSKGSNCRWRSVGKHCPCILAMARRENSPSWTRTPWWAALKPRRWSAAAPTQRRKGWPGRCLADAEDGRGPWCGWKRTRGLQTRMFTCQCSSRSILAFTCTCAAQNKFYKTCLSQVQGDKIEQFANMNKNKQTWGSIIALLILCQDYCFVGKGAAKVGWVAVCNGETWTRFKPENQIGCSMLFAKLRTHVLADSPRQAAAKFSKRGKV